MIYQFMRMKCATSHVIMTVYFAIKYLKMTLNTLFSVFFSTDTNICLVIIETVLHTHC